ncbi:hypothetical protein NBRC116602_19160 [Hyphomicrobiales bacterium 4NK60-0047b]
MMRAATATFLSVNAVRSIMMAVKRTEIIKTARCVGIDCPEIKKYAKLPISAPKAAYFFIGWF